MEDDKEGPEYPDIVVRLSGVDGNVFAQIGAVKNALRAAGERERAEGLMNEVDSSCKSYEEVLEFLASLVVVE